MYIWQINGENTLFEPTNGALIWNKMRPNCGLFASWYATIHSAPIINPVLIVNEKIDNQEMLEKDKQAATISPVDLIPNSPMDWGAIFSYIRSKPIRLYANMHMKMLYNAENNWFTGGTQVYSPCNVGSSWHLVNSISVLLCIVTIALRFAREHCAFHSLIFLKKIVLLNMKRKAEFSNEWKIIIGSHQINQCSLNCFKQIHCCNTFALVYVSPNAVSIHMSKKWQLQRKLQNTQNRVTEKSPVRFYCNLFSVCNDLIFL